MFCFSLVNYNDFRRIRQLPKVQAHRAYTATRGYAKARGEQSGRAGLTRAFSHPKCLQIETEITTKSPGA